MKVKITFYGQAADVIKSNSIEWDFDDRISAFGLKKSIQVKYPQISSIELKLAVNNKMVVKDFDLNDGDEISVLPPFSGG
ncbi:MAG: molybdopterin converting factor small subunit [Salibacteraceae bacterium]|jgi:molybdopterin converting factor small subunit